MLRTTYSTLASPDVGADRLVVIERQSFDVQVGIRWSLDPDIDACADAQPHVDIDLLVAGPGRDERLGDDGADMIAGVGVGRHILMLNGTSMRDPGSTRVVLGCQSDPRADVGRLLLLAEEREPGALGGRGVGGVDGEAHGRVAEVADRHGVAELLAGRRACR